MSFHCLYLFMMVTLWTNGLAFGVSRCPSKCICNENSIRCVERKLTVIPDFKSVNKSFSSLDLSGNDIEEVKTTNLFSNKLISLEYLHLNDNSINLVEVTAFSALPKLRYLDLSNNLLEDFPSHAIQRNRKLEELNLSGNLFNSKTPELISASLQILDLSFSKLSVFTESSLKDLPSLRVLYLHANSLKNVDSNVFAQVKLQYVDLSFNCWKCNCETIELFDYLVKNELTEIYRPIQCMHPNKWYEEIYNAKGPMHHNKLCKKIEHTNYQKDEPAKESKVNETSVKIEVKIPLEVSNNKEVEVEPEGFVIYIGSELMIGGIVLIVFTIVLTVVTIIVISKTKKPKYNIYEELGENAFSSSITSQDLFPTNKNYNRVSGVIVQ